jgi:hypothetical protein
VKYRRAVELEDDNESVWDAKRREIAGTQFPADFPARSLLISCGYLVREEVEGATDLELRRAGLSRSQAAAVVAAIG